MISFKEFCQNITELSGGQTALHLLPPAGISRKVLKGKIDFDAHIKANAPDSKKQRGGDGRMYHIKNGRVHGVWNSEAGTGVVYTSDKNESTELDEATFVSNSPTTHGSSGAKFDVKKNKEKSTGEHANGQPKEYHDVFHEGKHVGHVASYSGYKDKKPTGSRIVTSRKDVRMWQATIHGGEHNRHGSAFNTTPAGSQYTETGFASKKDALQHFADAHNSNQNRR